MLLLCWCLCRSTLRLSTAACSFALNRPKLAGANWWHQQPCVQANYSMWNRKWQQAMAGVVARVHCNSLHPLHMQCRKPCSGDTFRCLPQRCLVHWWRGGAGAWPVQRWAVYCLAGPQTSCQQHSMRCLWWREGQAGCSGTKVHECSARCPGVVRSAHRRHVATLACRRRGLEVVCLCSVEGFTHCSTVQ